MPKITTSPRITKPNTQVMPIEYFGGIDLSNQPSNVEKKRSCDGINMIRDEPGKVRKRTGYYIKRRYPARVNGVFEFRDKLIIHSGTKIYLDGDEPEELFDGMEDVKTDAKQLAGKLWFGDGVNYLCYDGETVQKVNDIAFVPTVTISKDPDGGGVTYQPVNMISEKRTDSFLGKASVTVYQLSFENLSSIPVTAKKQNSNGEWIDLTEGTDFTVDRTTGKVTFTTAPGAPPVTGEDNVTVTYGVINEDYVGRVNGCKFGICYGAQGATDRLFISGNAKFPNYDFYSQQNDPTYFGDLWYGVMGQEHSPIVGYSIINNYLATHKRNDDNDRNIILRFGNLVSEESGGSDESLGQKMSVQFRIVDIIQGEGAISHSSFGYSREPMFLTPRGIYATTPYEYTTERYVQNRSAYINGVLTTEQNPEDAYACVYEDFYMLALNGKVYILDTLERSYEKESYSNHQYEAYLWDNVPARIMFTHEGSLCFGTDSGEIMCFFDDNDAITSYMDNVDPDVVGSGDAIKARWDFDFSGDDFYQNKRIKYFAVLLAPSIATSVSIYARVKNAWRALLTIGGEARYLSFEKLVFSKFSFSGDTNPRTIGKKIKIKKVDAVRFSLRNEEPNEPFGIYRIALEYTEGGYYKG